MPGQLGEYPRFYPVFRIGAAIEILREQLLSARMRDEVVIKELEVRLREPAVAVPPHRILGERIDDGVLVLGAAAGMDPGFRTQRAPFDDGRFARGDRVLIERGGPEIPMDR